MKKGGSPDSFHQLFWAILREQSNMVWVFGYDSSLPQAWHAHRRSKRRCRWSPSGWVPLGRKLHVFRWWAALAYTEKNILNKFFSFFCQHNCLLCFHLKKKRQIGNRHLGSAFAVDKKPRSCQLNVPSCGWKIMGTLGFSSRVLDSTGRIWMTLDISCSAHCNPSQNHRGMSRRNYYLWWFVAGAIAS